ncbi:MAG: hypothetical protein K0S12_167, partial [Bacteroidetes bacterium]|nr:hypothetical protein [Bacteroidota bacterium]
MNRVQKIIFGAFVTLSLIAAALGYRYLQENKQPSVEARSLIPDSCTILITFDNYSEFTNSLRHKNLLWQDLNGISSTQLFEKHLSYFDSLLSLNAELKELMDDNQVHFALYKDNKFLIAFNVKELADQNVFREKLTSLFPSSLYIHLKSEVQDGVIGISNSETALSALFSKNAKLINNPDFLKLDAAVDYNGAFIYVNNSDILKSSYSSISIKPESISLNGVALKDPGTFYGETNSEPLKNFEFLRQIPLLCNAFEVFSIKNAAAVFGAEKNEDWWKDVNESSMFNAKKQFYESLNNYAISALMPSKNNA